MSQPLDEILSSKEQLIVIDTNVARTLAEEVSDPTWLPVLLRMRESGYAFSLSDVAFAELTAQIARGSIDKENHDRMLNRLEGLLNKSLPVMPSKVDILASIGGSPPSDIWSVKEMASLSQRAWNHLREMTSGDESLGSCEYMLSEERDDWKATIEEFKKTTETLEDCCANLDKKKEFPWPPYSVRSDLQLKYLFRQGERSNKKKHAYNPDSDKNKNDGIDFDIYRNLMIPALVLTSDSGFHERISDIESFQKAWIFRPEELADRFEAGELPKAIWPRKVNK